MVSKRSRVRGGVYMCMLCACVCMGGMCMCKAVGQEDYMYEWCVYVYGCAGVMCVDLWVGGVCMCVYVGGCTYG